MSTNQAARRFSIGTTMSLVVLVVLGGSVSNAQLVYDGYNIYAVQNNAPYPAIFHVSGLGWQVSSIADYHYNNGVVLPLGTTFDITITDLNNNVIDGPFPAVNTAPGAGPFDYIATVNKFLKSGWYYVQDSGGKTWSWNVESAREGFTRIFGIAFGAHAHPKPAPKPSTFVPMNCGNYWPSTTTVMFPCIGPSGTIITMTAVNRGLAAPLGTATFKLAQTRFGNPGGIVLPITVAVSGGGTAPGSMYTVAVPAGLCAGGQYSVWWVYAFDVNGISQGVLAQFTITGCP